jgi:uncharacterized protein YndB with AHSA1/START domain
VEPFKYTRVFDAPRALIWETLTKSEHLLRWWGPKGMSVRVHCLDLMPGGLFHYSMVVPGGKQMWGKWIYREISPTSRLVFVQSFSDEEAGVTRHPMAPDWPREVLSTFELTEENGKTTLHMTGVPVTPTEAERAIFESSIDSMRKGFDGTWSVLDEYLALARQGDAHVDDRVMIVSRVIDAPREKIFDAWSDPARIARWWGPKGFHNTNEKFEFKPGGKWKFVMHGPDGKNYPNDNSFVEIVRPSRIVVHHGPTPVFQITATFEDLGGGKTKVVWRGVFESAQALAAVKSFAVPGAEENLEKLAAEVASSS